MSRPIDLNCDMGESFGVYRYGADAEMMPYITSANIACGFHGGDPTVMRETVRLAKQYGVRVGAHIGLPDREGFGRRRMEISPEEVYNLTLYQLGALDAFVRAEGMKMSHVKLHGALYMMAVDDAWLAEAFTNAVLAYDAALTVFSMPDCAMSRCAQQLGLHVVYELFADRPYSNGKVKMFGWTYEEIGSPDCMASRVREMLEQPLYDQIGTICVHSDTTGAPSIMKALKEQLQSE